MASLAIRNLLHDKVRLVVTLTGVIFAVVLFSVQIGLFFGFKRATADVIDHSGADIWITGKDVSYLENGVLIKEQKRYDVLETEGVEIADKYLVGFAQLKVASGSEKGIMLVGFNPDTGLGGPWNLTAGSVQDLKQADTIIIDEIYKDKLKVTHLGQTVEILGKRARVVGFTRGIRTFTTSPAVFTSFKNAQTYRGIAENQMFYLLVKAKAGTDVSKLKQDLLSRLENVEVYTNAEFGKRTQDYWMFGTGAGVTVLIAAILGLIVGVVVVAQTIYSATMDHLKEFGTLKAMGASNGYIYRVIIKQALVSACVGYVVGIGIALTAVYISRQGQTAIVLPTPAVIVLFGLTLLMCVGASLISINKVTHLDPAMVFKG